ncbi:hypothetical protein MMC13_000721 [Lambiella insularis]|nr:hypothetical protein [Lambiella insularis]
MMDTAPGGENTQYESIDTQQKPHAKQGGQMGEPQSSEDSVSEVQQQEKSKRGKKTAENARYGEAISEHGFGGETTGNSGEANQGGYGVTDIQDDADSAEKTREEQGYGPGSGVGA